MVCGVSVGSPFCSTDTFWDPYAAPRNVTIGKASGRRGLGTSCSGDTIMPYSHLSGPQKGQGGLRVQEGDHV